MTTAFEQNLMASDLSKIRQHWETPPYPDEIIEAYKAGKTSSEKLMIKGFLANLEKACSIAEETYGNVQNEGVKCELVRMKAESSVCFKALYIINVEDYVSGAMDRIRDIAWRVEQESESDSFRIEFSFMANSDNLDDFAMNSDGFILKYPISSKR